MTTTIKVRSHNHPAKIETFDSGIKTNTEVLTPIDGEREFNCTVSRELRITDIEYDDVRVINKK